MTIKIVNGDALTVLRTMKSNCIQCVVTSPPYWGLRDYGGAPQIWGGDPNCKHEFSERRWYTENSAAKTNGSVEAFSKAGAQNAQRLKDARWRTDATCQHCGAWRGALGLEQTPNDFVAHITEIFREVRRVLRDDGALWLNLGDSYVGGGRGGNPPESAYQKQATNAGSISGAAKNKWPIPDGLKHKDLVGIPWRVAFALQQDGWYLRQDIIWAKPNPMPESVRDRCTKSHEYLFMFSKQPRYYFDADAIAEPLARPDEATRKTPGKFGGANKWVEAQKQSRYHSGNEYRGTSTGTRNRRSVWTITTKPFKEAHFATFPPDLVEPCILAGSPEWSVILDPFAGSGTVGMVANKLNRHAILIELNASYCQMAERRCGIAAPLMQAAE